MGYNIYIINSKIECVLLYVYYIKKNNKHIFYSKEINKTRRKEKQEKTLHFPYQWVYAKVFFIFLYIILFYYIAYFQHINFYVKFMCYIYDGILENT